MRSREAFSVLTEAVEAALQESLARSNVAAQQGNFETVEVEVERQKNLVSARDQLQVLQELWPGLVGERQVAEKPKRTRRRTRKSGRVPRGVKTPQDVFVIPVLTALEELGGSAPAAKVLDIVGRLMSGALNKYDFSQLKNGQIRWRNTAQWARLRMKKDDLVADDSPRGIWEITERGRAFLREQVKENSGVR